MAVCARKFLPHEDEVIINCITGAPSLHDGLQKAAAQLGRSFRSVESRYRRLKSKGLVSASAQSTAPSCKVHQTFASAQSAANSNMNRVIQRLLDNADAVVIYAGDYECRIVRTKRVQLAAVKQSTG